MKLRLALILLVLPLAGCGGSKPYSLSRAQTCLDGSTQVAATSTSNEDLDYIAQDAGEGAVAFRMADGDMGVVVFERSAGDAGATAKSYAAFPGVNAANVEEHRNAVIVWDKSPRAADASLVRDCLDPKFVSG